MPNWTIRQPVIRDLAVFVAAAMLSWPAFLNGLALLYPDSVEYLIMWPHIAARLHERSPIIVNRSVLFYGWLNLWKHHALWPIVFVQALLIAWILWLVVRSFVTRHLVTCYLLAVALLAVFTSVAWFVSYVMADVYGPMLYLSCFLLVFAADTLRPWERVGLYLIAFLATVSHSSHLMVAAGLCVVLTALWLLGWQGMRRRGAALVVIASVLVVAVCAQVWINRRIFGDVSLFGKPPAFLMARLIEDGPAREYLQQHCPINGWLICNAAHRLPTDANVFLYEPGNVWQSATAAERDEFRREQTPLALAVLRTYPGPQAAGSLRNFVQLLFRVGPEAFGDYPILRSAQMDQAEPGLRERYLRTSQSRYAMPEKFFQWLQRVAALASVAVILLLLPWAWKAGETRLIGLAVVVLFALVANAFVGGVLSGVFTRYQDRVAWMIELLAGLMLVVRRASRTHA